MPRRQREDFAGSFHHVFNRAIARRTMFEGRDDIRFFLAQVARAVRRGEIRLRAYSILTTHYHLFVESSGRLAGAMRRIQSEYSRRFNRTRRRDGPLVRSRYASRRVESDRYLVALVHYIDRNAVQAGLVDSPEDYDYGSARFLSQGRVPPWLDQEWFIGALEPPDDRSYEDTFGGAGSDIGEIVQRRLALPNDLEDPMDDLVGAAPEQVLAWMHRKARMADGTRAGLPVARADWVLRAVELHSTEIDVLALRRGRPSIVIRRRIIIALLRQLCGLRQREIATSASASQGTVNRILDRHRLAIFDDDEYAILAARVAVSVLNQLPMSARRPVPVFIRTG